MERGGGGGGAGGGGVHERQVKSVSEGLGVTTTAMAGFAILVVYNRSLKSRHCMKQLEVLMNSLSQRTQLLLLPTHELALDRRGRSRCAANPVSSLGTLYSYTSVTLCIIHTCTASCGC